MLPQRSQDLQVAAARETRLDLAVGQLAKAVKVGLDRAIGELRTAVRLGPGDWLAHYRLATALLRRDDLAGAAAELEEAVRLNPSAKQAYAAYSDYVLDQSFTIGLATLLPRVATTARVRGVKYDMAYILHATEAWLA